VFLAKVKAKSTSNIYTGSTLVKIVKNNLVLSELISQTHIGVCEVENLTDKLTNDQIKIGLKKVNFNTVDDVVANGLVIKSGENKIGIDGYSRTVVLKVDPNSELAEIVDLNSEITITAYGCLNGQIIFKLKTMTSAYENKFLDKDDYVNIYDTLTIIGRTDTEKYPTTLKGFSYPRTVNGNTVTFKNGQGERPAIAEANPIVKIVG
jgi:hypothetical protein